MSRTRINPNFSFFLRDSIVNKFKLSQNRNEQDFVVLKEHLNKRNDPTLQFMK